MGFFLDIGTKFLPILWKSINPGWKHRQRWALPQRNFQIGSILRTFVSFLHKIGLSVMKAVLTRLYELEVISDSTKRVA